MMKLDQKKEGEREGETMLVDAPEYGCVAQASVDEE